MEDKAAYRLNELFKRWAGDKKLAQSELLMTFTTATGDKVTIHPSTPHHAASYFRSIIKSDSPLFRPGDVHCEAHTETCSRPGSILFKGFGYVRDNRNSEHYKTVLHMNFTGVPGHNHQIGETEAHGYVSFHDDFGDDPMQPMHAHNGPTLHEFIRTLEAAGNDWSNMHFKTHSTRMNAGGAPMQLIK